MSTTADEEKEGIASKDRSETEQDNVATAKHNPPSEESKEIVDANTDAEKIDVAEEETETKPKPGDEEQGIVATATATATVTANAPANATARVPPANPNAKNSNRNSNPNVGAFAVHNPLFESSSGGQSQPQSQSDAVYDPTEPSTTTSTTPPVAAPASSTSLPPSTSSSSQTNRNRDVVGDGDGDEESTTNTTNNNNNIVQATFVEEQDDESVLEAHIVTPDSKQEGGGSSKLQRGIAAAVVFLLLAMSVALIVVFTQQQRAAATADGSTIDTTNGGGAGGGGIATTIGLPTRNDENELRLMQQRREELRSVLVSSLNNDAAKTDGVFDETSPDFSPHRSAALDWLARDEYLLQLLPTVGVAAEDDDGEDSGDDDDSSNNTSTSTSSVENVENTGLWWRIRQRYVLALLYYSTNGAGWFEQYNFLADIDECEWARTKKPDNFGDFGSGQFEIKGVVCNSDGQIQSMRMWYNQMSGTLPPELSEFSKSLTEMNLTGGTVAGPLPESFANMDNLQQMYIGDQCLTGTVPDLSGMPALHSLWLHLNPDLTGSMNSVCEIEVLDLPLIAVGDCTAEIEGEAPNIECDCCVSCCNHADFMCCYQDGNCYASMTLSTVSPEGFAPSFVKPCLKESTKEYIRDECPCLVDQGSDDGYRRCTTDCSAEGAIPSHNF